MSRRSHQRALLGLVTALLAIRVYGTGILAPRTFALPKPVATRVEAKGINTVEWGLQAIHADQVWSTFGVRGEGITVANVDTGVEYTHPAVVGKYRGNLGN